MTKPEQVNAQVQIIKAIADAIKELGSIPSGHLYAQLMGKMSLEQYNGIVNVLVSSGLIVNEGHVLTWKGV